MNILTIRPRGGSASVELYRRVEGTESRVAQIIYWDAVGQFFVEKFNDELPLEILEELIAEAKQSIKTK
jgi:hypothetical protein